QRFCQSKSNTEIVDVLTGLKQCVELLGQRAPEMMVSNNCCAICNAVLAVFPQVDSIQDVWHFIVPRHHHAVMANITNAVLKKHARDGDCAGAEYYSWHEQEEWLISAYDKWSENGMVWLATSLKVHQEQLKHVWKGCLEHCRQDVLSDRSHIEGCHKAWNALQHAQPSRLMMLTVLSHNFVLCHNLHIASEKAKSSPSAALSAHGSHHLHLSSAIADLFNQLHASKPGCQLPPIAQLHAADSGETFSLVESEHSRMFEALSITQDLLFNEWHINLKLLDQPANLSSQTSPTMAMAPADTTSATQWHSHNVPASGQPDSLTAMALSDRSQVTLDSFFKISSAPNKMQGPTMPVQCIAGKTRSQQIFSIMTGIPPESLTVNGEDEFYLFMEMRAKFGWLSYQMTSWKWVNATNEYNW
ncbi:hypothetical protein EDD15DRAFT_2167798, partial [Pisolithus albus]